MKKTLYTHARLFDPSDGLDENGSLLVEDGRIVATRTTETPPDAEIIDCGGRLLCPGLIDMCVFTGEPGSEHRETLGSASQAAAAGGVSTIIVMPDTSPVIDDVSLVDFIGRRARDTAIVRVHTMAAITRGLAGRQMVEMGLLRDAGAVAFTDAEHAITDSAVMRRSLDYAGFLGALIIGQAQQPELAENGVMNEGELASRLGLQGIPVQAEVMMIERDLRLVELTQTPYHVAQVSCAASVEVVRQAKARGLPVTCGVAATHLTLNEQDVGNYLTFCKLSPPLRTEEDRLAVLEGLRDGTIDVIVSGHNPQDPETKRLPIAQAAFGAVGLETLLPAVLSLVHNGELDLACALQAMTSAPADLLNLPGGRLQKGAPADFILVDLDIPWVLDRDTLRSKSKNSPWDGRQFQGRAIKTVVDGKTVFTYGET